jgi:hypothetical protein
MMGPSASRGVHMGMTGGASDTAILIVCPTCGEVYDSPERVRDMLRNWGVCVNITCMTDLSRLPVEAVPALERGDRRGGDRRTS